jgi:ABC-2 type transport system permease protein
MSAAASTGSEVQGLGRAIKGPSALGSDPRRLWHLTWTLARTEFKLAFFGSALGYLWQLMRPLLLFGVIYLVLSHFATAHKPVPGAAPSPFLYGQYLAPALLLGIVLFTFFSEATAGAVTSLVNRENLVRKIEFPRLAVPLSIVLTALFNITLNLVPVLIFLLAAGGTPQLSWLELPLLVIALALFCTGLGMILSVGFVRYRDVRPIWEVVLQATFYASGIFFAITGLAPLHIFGLTINLSHLLMANPFAAILEQARHVFISPSYPSAASAMGGGALILIPIAITIGTVVFGYIYFNRQAPYVAEQL